MVMPNHTVAVDDALTRRWVRCLDCGQEAPHLALVQVAGLVHAIPRCPRCWRADPQATALIARLAQREDTPR